MRSIALAVSALAFAGLASAATSYDTSLASPGCYIGTGCVNAGWTVDNNGTTELGLTAILRYVGPLPESGNTYSAPTGVDSSGDALWDFSFSIDTQPGGVGSTNLSDYTYSISITDTLGDINLTGNPLLLPDNNLNGATGAQNSENLEFADVAPFNQSFDPNAIDTYTVTLTETSNATGMVDNSVSIEIAATPEPGTILLFGTGLAGLALVARRRTRKS